MPKKPIKEDNRNVSSNPSPENPVLEDRFNDVVSSALSVSDDPDRYMTPAERQLAREQAIQARQERQDEENIISDFIIASKTGAHMEAKVSGVEIDDNDAYWVCYCGPIAVRIPFKESFDVLPDELLDTRTPRLMVRRRQFLSKSIDVTVPFVVTNFVADPDGHYTAIGSRVAALKLIRRRYYGTRAAKPIKVGDIVDARVLNVGPAVMWINIWGADIRVMNHHLSYRYISDMTEIYYPDDMIKVQVMALETKADGSVVMSVSSRPLELADAKKRHHLIKPGNRYAAIITSIRNEPTMHVELWLEGINVPAYAATKEIRTDYGQKNSIHSGSYVYVEVLGITKRGYVHVKLLPGKGRAGRR